MRSHPQSEPGVVGHGRESGYATAEFAVALPAVMVVLAFVIGALQALIVHHRALHAASVGARVAARGESPRAVTDAVTRTGVHGATVHTRQAGDIVTVQVRPRIPGVLSWSLPDLAGEVSAFREQDFADDPVAP